jgi:3-dehydroquinate synthase
LTIPRKTRDGKQRFAVPDKAFGQCVFLNDVSIEELQSVLRTHKSFIKERFGSGEGKEAYVDAGDLGVSPDAYLKKTNGGSNGDAKSGAVKAGAVPMNGNHVANGVCCFFMYSVTS